MKEIFNITERDSTWPISSLSIVETQPGRMVITIDPNDSEQSSESITLDRAELLGMARAIIQKLEAK